MCMCMFVSIHMCMSTCSSMCSCMCLCICMDTEREREISIHAVHALTARIVSPVCVYRTEIGCVVLNEDSVSSTAGCSSDGLYSSP